MKVAVSVKLGSIVISVYHPMKRLPEEPGISWNVWGWDLEL